MKIEVRKIRGKFNKTVIKCDEKHCGNLINIYHKGIEFGDIENVKDYLFTYGNVVQIRCFCGAVYRVRIPVKDKHMEKIGKSLFQG